MDQNNQSYDTAAPAPHRRNASYYRSRARETMKKNLGIIILASFLSFLLVNGISSVISSFTSSLSTLMKTISLSFVLPVVGVLGVLSTVLSLTVGGPVLVGYEKFRLDAINGKPLKLDTLFYGFRTCFGKSVLAQLIYMLISLAAAIPTILPAAFIYHTLGSSFFRALIAAMSDPESATIPEIAEQTLPLLSLGLLLLFLGSIATLILQVILSYRYIFVNTILAEFPETSVTDAFRNAASMMQGKKGKLFCLDLSFIGWYLLAALLACCTCGLGAAVATLFLSPYTEHARTAFYDDAANRSAAREAVFPSLNPDDYSVD
ncbi:MAG: DUF975 family protein [Clostridia bacterium]|nr:DUF975 family protein [Clostridia bacterium]